MLEVPPVPRELIADSFFSVTHPTPRSIESAMRKLALPTAATVLLLFATLSAETPGIFRGVVIHGPDITPGWMYLKGTNGQVRRVGISRAQVVYSESVPTGERQKMPALSIVTGADVRVTAEQDKNGEWRAIKIEILGLHSDLPIAPSRRSEDIRSS